MKHYNDQELIEGVKTHNSKVLRYIYQEYFPYVKNFVLQHGGSADQAQDIFQEGMIIIFRKACDGKFTLTCKFSTYLVAVCRRLWIQEKKKTKLRKEKTKELLAVEEPTTEYESALQQDIMEIFERNLQQVSSDCQKIMRMFLNDCKAEEIRKEMGYRTVHHAVDRKYRCKKSLIMKILKDPAFIKMKNEILD